LHAGWSNWAEGEDKVTDALSAMEYPHWLIVAGAILVVLGLVGLAFRERLAPIEPAENRPVTTGKGSNRTGKRRPWEGAAQNRRDDKNPPTPGLTTGKDLRDVNEEMFADIVELYEPKTMRRNEKP
jgi:hypothetical protein